MGAPVQMFWHGPRFSRIERLCIRSFVACGHAVHLYAYQDDVEILDGVERRDAREVLPEDALFLHEKSGSFAMFADWFRFQLLATRGGLWADTDVVCLRPLEYELGALFGWEDARHLNNAILGFSPGHPLPTHLAKRCENPNALMWYDPLDNVLVKLRRRWREGNLRSNVEWGELGPVELTRAAKYFGYLSLARPSAELYPIHYHDWKCVFDGSVQLDSPRLASAATIHLWHQMMRIEPGFDKNARFASDSLFEALCRKFDVASERV